MSEPTRGVVKSDAPVEDGNDAALSALRGRIDAVDREILDALNRRAAVVEEVGDLKRAHKAPVYRAARERDLVAGLMAENPGPFPTSAIPNVFREIVSATYALEGPFRVAFLGPEGTFSHVAVRQAFGAHAEALAQPTIADVFAAVERGEAEHGVVPIENTTEGVVTQTLDTLVESSLPVCGETALRISMCLLSQSGQLGDVRRVASHPQPLAQCRGWLDRHLPGAERIEQTSTVAAAELAAREADVAAVGSPIAGELLGLEVIAASIEDRRDNTTRFLIVGGEAPRPSSHDLTSVVFTVRKTQSGALHRLLEPFAEEGVNLTSIQSRPLKGAPWEYIFVVDLEGHVSEPQVERALARSAEVANSMRVLGSFPRAAQATERPK